ncbi:MAG: hypothetical protein ACLPX5_01670 [Dissulfurispiraceae bacterium]
MLGIFSYFLYWFGLKFINQISPDSFSLKVVFLRSLTNSASPFSYREIAIVCVLAICLGVIISATLNHKLWNKLARFSGITKKFGELDVWGYFLNIKEIVWVTVRDHKNNLIYDGWVQAFSDDSKDAELLLRDVSIFKNDSGEFLYQSGAVYLSRNREDISIECRSLPISEEFIREEEEKHEQVKGDTKTYSESDR